MKLISYNKNGKIHIGALENEMVYPLHELNAQIADNMKDLLQDCENQLLLAKNIIENTKPTISISDVELICPVPKPPSVRDAYAFRQHVATARKNRGLDMIPEFDEIPIFYFTNHNAVFGPGNFPVLKQHTEKLDFELECAAVIGKRGRNISSDEADDYIAGFMIMNDFSARALQMQEMKLNLGPAKGKDFGSSFGPYLVTKDELEPYKKTSSEGDRYDWHQDESEWCRNKRKEERIRKVSFVLLLNDDFEGGEFMLINQEIPLNKGSAIFFHADDYHQVNAVTKGERMSLVGWIQGPPWV